MLGDKGVGGRKLKLLSPASSLSVVEISRALITRFGFAYLLRPGAEARSCLLLVANLAVRDLFSLANHIAPFLQTTRFTAFILVANRERITSGALSVARARTGTLVVSVLHSFEYRTRQL